MRRSSGWVILMSGMLMYGLPIDRGEAVNPETVLMPGKLTSAHEKYEEDCTHCHDRTDRARQRELCLACHKEIAADITGHSGFHGRLSGIEGSQCSGCHSEHLGRAADIVKLSEPFDHAMTDFELAGAHASLTCESCHRPKDSYGKAPSDCYSCHSKGEPHQGKLGKECGSCHNAVAWRRLNYDHSKTSFPLRGKHGSVPCVQCHFGNRYKDTPPACVACHAPDDVHVGERGPKCADCHTAEGWKTAKFDHFKQTGFALVGVHDRIDCQDCHRSGRLKDPLPKDCHGCHQGEDSHAGRLGKECGKCHGNEKWAPPTFDHTRDTKYPLEGRHAKVACHACHTAPTATQKLATECHACHRASDVHSGKLGTDCAQCHSLEGWRVNIAFDHDLSDFPLVGLHVAVPCEQCHLTRAYKDVGQECLACHQADDVHKGGLGKDCARCHSPNGWRIWDFDHGKETGFALTGAHAKLTCSSCHKQPPDEVELDSGCVSCHAQDDVHLGQYGRQCQRCHSTVTFKGARLR
ncbi:MAG TPA: hypothetical protein VLB75_09575 [Steroidobacteraceae bacterium]|nr:hypothetical protein [Steroidobacteraceae bacterium]